MLSIIFHQENANQNHSKIPPHTHQNGYNLRQATPSVSKDDELWELCFAADGRVKMVWSLWKTIWHYTLKVNTSEPYSSAIPFLGIYPTEAQVYVHHNTCTPVFIVMLLSHKPDTTQMFASRLKDRL